LQEKLETFKIYIENLTVTPGPVVTQYEFVPAPGIKISKIESYADDLAMALKAKGIRIIAPIPGKGTVGVEIPNSNPSMVTFCDTIRSAKFAQSTASLPLCLGKNISGEVFIVDLAKMPHLLIAGSTGSGKSVGINTIISSLLYKRHPSELKFVIIDPKKVRHCRPYKQSKVHVAQSPIVVLYFRSAEYMADLKLYNRTCEGNHSRKRQHESIQFFTLCNSAFKRAVSIACSETSIAVIEALGYIFASVIAMQPVPVPISNNVKSFDFEILENCSIINSVSGLGINTSGRQKNFNP
jgi:hypothetical protein